MSQPHDEEFIRELVAPVVHDLDAAFANHACLKPSRLWSVASGLSKWTDTERRHLDACPRCQCLVPPIQGSIAEWEANAPEQLREKPSQKSVVANETAATGAASAETVAGYSSLESRQQKAVQLLTEEERLLIDLHRGQKLGVDEIAKRLGLSQDETFSRLSVAISRLGSALRRLDEDAHTGGTARSDSVGPIQPQ